MKKAALSKHERRLRSRYFIDRIAVVSFGDRFLVEIGPVSLMLEREAAENLMCDLADALEPGDPLGIGTIGAN